MRGKSAQQLAPQLLKASVAHVPHRCLHGRRRALQPDKVTRTPLRSIGREAVQGRHRRTSNVQPQRLILRESFQLTQQERRHFSLQKSLTGHPPSSKVSHDPVRAAKSRHIIDVLTEDQQNGLQHILLQSTAPQGVVGLLATEQLIKRQHHVPADPDGGTREASHPLHRIFDPLASKDDLYLALMENVRNTCKEQGNTTEHPSMVRMSFPRVQAVLQPTLITNQTSTLKRNCQTAKGFNNRHNHIRVVVETKSSPQQHMYPWLPKGCAGLFVLVRHCTKRSATRNLQSAISGEHLHGPDDVFVHTTAHHLVLPLAIAFRAHCANPFTEVFQAVKVIQRGQDQKNFRDV
mmetsp:Transcript_58464/g.136042  ORF Transcript_58464/g.136042 Transcript_58464/m.136042 type:complete len:348 (+) Transcript_58464:274-1317(+)|eukprot:CAMPEP_0171084400 /NCGR_PEP_ID=MMETSP0766_2-20121228/18289_1 /TAXON_ID=439317 /ORGANISM="Gambierdiscus australes, Strain CAWD 149" /LENGTH=347 /DNA_ID=CAMNT_0011541903 /DNA_START=243 /DNA_END=1286 /DNA_ORIENTATION=+